MKVSAQAWNQFVDQVFRSRVVSVTAREADPWRHPWFTVAGWSQDLDAYAIRVKPGYCLSGESGGAQAMTVSARVPYDFAPPLTVARLDRSLAGRNVDAWLREEPALPIARGIWRAIGTDGEPFGEVERVPKYFRKRGVNPSPRGRTDAFGITITDGVASDGYPFHDRPRLLRACDLVLYHDRQANATDWQIGSGVEGTIAQFRVMPTARPDFQDRPYLRLVSKLSPPPPLDPVAYLLGGVEDGGTDSIKIATIYLVSVPDERAGAQPEAEPWKWTAHVRHHVWWNLRYVTSRFSPGPEVLPLEVPGLELAGGALLTLAPLVAAGQDAYQQALAFVTTRLIEGRFVTL